MHPVLWPIGSLTGNANRGDWGGWRRSGLETAGLRRSRSAARSLFRSGWRSGAVSPPKAQPGGSPLRPPRPRADPRKSGGIAVTNSYPDACLTGSRASRTLAGHGAAGPDPLPWPSCELPENRITASVASSFFSLQPEFAQRDVVLHGVGPPCRLGLPVDLPRHRLQTLARGVPVVALAAVV